jgi:LacI family transcriptional regulator
VIGFDDVPIARYVTPPLSTMGIRIAELGERAVERLVATIDDPASPPAEPEHFVPRLVARGSTRRRAGAGHGRKPVPA